MVIFLPLVSNSRYLVKSSSNESLFASTNFNIAAAVNCLVTEPISKIPLLGIGTESSKFAIPYDLFNSISPFLNTRMAPPAI